MPPVGAVTLMPSEVWLLSDDPTSLPSGPNRSIRRSWIGSASAGCGVQSIWKRMSTSSLGLTDDGTLTLTWCSSRKVSPLGSVGSHAPVASSNGRLASRWLNGAWRSKVARAPPGLDGRVTLTSYAAAACTDVASSPVPARPRAAARTAGRRSRGIRMGPPMYRQKATPRCVTVISSVPAQARGDARAASSERTAQPHGQPPLTPQRRVDGGRRQPVDLHLLRHPDQRGEGGLLGPT